MISHFSLVACVRGATINVWIANQEEQCVKSSLVSTLGGKKKSQPRYWIQNNKNSKIDRVIEQPPKKHRHRRQILRNGTLLPLALGVWYSVNPELNYRLYLEDNWSRDLWRIVVEHLCMQWYMLPVCPPTVREANAVRLEAWETPVHLPEGREAHAWNTSQWRDQLAAQPLKHPYILNVNTADEVLRVQ